MKKWPFIRGNRMEYFIYLLLLSTLLIITFAITIYYYTSNKLVKEAIQNNTNTLQLLRNAQETVMNEVDRSLENVFFDSVYSSFNDYYEEQDILMVVKIQEKLDNIVFMNKYIHSLSLVYPEFNRVLSDQGIKPINEFSDKLFIENVLKTPYQRGEVFTRKIMGIRDVEEQDVITLVKTIPMISPNPIAYLIVNVKAGYLLDTLNMIKTNESAHILVMDSSGGMIAQKSSQETDHYHKLFEKLLPLGDEEETGYQIVGTNTSGTLISYVNSNRHDWLFLYTIPMSDVIGSMKLWRQALLALCLLMTFFGMISSYVLSGRILSPIRRMLSLVRSEISLGSIPVHVKETSQLEMNIHSILHRTRTMEEQLRSYEDEIRKRLLQSLLEGKQTVPDDRLFETFQYYGQEVDLEGCYTVLLVSMDHYSNFCMLHSEKERNTLFLELTRVIEQQVMKNKASFVVEFDSGEIAGVLHQKDALEPEAEQQAKEVARSLHEQFGTIANVAYTFTIGVSTAKMGFSELSRAYYEAQSAVNDNIIYGENTVICYRAEQAENEVVLYPHTIEKKMVVALKSGDEENAYLALEDFGLYIQNMTPTVRGIMKYYFLQFYTSSLKCVVEVNPDLVALLELANPVEPMELDTLPDMLNFMKQFCEKVFNYYNSFKRITKNEEISEQICDYIRHHPNEDLSQERIGEMFKISSSHLRKIFKEETGQTLKDFILYVRIEQAKELLKNTDMKVADIAINVGYLSSQSFVRVFRQVTGMTPGEFREFQV
jgi:two-component system, response regulator YesN